MPKYRQLHIKILDSFDFAEMPDDFTRVVWLLLIPVVDSEGRGIDNPAWLRSKMFPLRPDVELNQISAAMDWLGNRGMVRRYKVGGKSYFCIPTWKEYQTGTDKEAKSILPAPDLLPTYSEPTPPQYNADSDSDSYANADSESAPIPAPTPLFQPGPEARADRIYQKVTGHFTIPSKDKIPVTNVLIMYYNKYKSEDAAAEALLPFWDEWRRRKYGPTNLNWLIEWAASGEIPQLKSNGNGSKPTQQSEDDVMKEILEELKNERRR
jgi:hypothetical protein